MQIGKEVQGVICETFISFPVAAVAAVAVSSSCRRARPGPPPRRRRCRPPVARRPDPPSPSCVALRGEERGPPQMLLYSSITHPPRLLSLCSSLCKARTIAMDAVAHRRRLEPRQAKPRPPSTPPRRPLHPHPRNQEGAPGFVPTVCILFLPGRQLSRKLACDVVLHSPPFLPPWDPLLAF